MSVKIFSLLPRKSISILVSVLMLPSIAYPAAIQKDFPPKATPTQAPESPDVSHIIAEFTAGEAEFRQAFKQYGYKRDLVIRTMRNGKVTGEYRRVSQIVLGEDGTPEEKVISFPKPSLTEITVTSQDLEDLSDKYQFALEASEANKYKFNYVGKERIENVDLYVFDVKPLSLTSKERRFEGRIWVGVNSLRIVKTRGKGAQKGNQRFPVMEVYRAAVEDRYLFPSSAFADQELVFGSGQAVHLRVGVRYTDYAKLK